MKVTVRALVPGHAPGLALISTAPRHSHGWLSTNAFAERYSPESIPAVETNCAKPHWNCLIDAASSVGISAGSARSSAGTRPGLSTVRRLLHAAVSAMLAVR